MVKTACEEALLTDSKVGLGCLGTKKKPTDTTRSEDCLFLNVQAPTHATPGSKLPVMVYIQGGGFNTNGNPNVNGTGLIKAADNDLVYVTFNYRVGPYGFLTNGDEVTPNNGLRDQRKALEWVQQHISKFGGDPRHVVLIGTSAGAASVVFHLTANGGKDRGLFIGAAANEPSFATELTVKESQFYYNNLAVRAGCAVKDSLSCLRNKTAAELQAVNFNIPLPGGTNPPAYQWLPVIDGDFLPDYTYKLINEGKFIKVPTILGDDKNGGTKFAPNNASSLANSNQYMLDQYPTITPWQFADINPMYPNPNDTCPNKGCYWRQTSNTYQEVRYTCPAFHINEAMTKAGAKSYAYLWDVEDPDEMSVGLGVPHTAELEALIGPDYTDDEPESYKPGGINELASPLIQAYYTSFVRTLDPNSFKLKGAAEWKTWSEEPNKRLRYGTNGTTGMEDLGDGLRKRCDYWIANGVNMLL